MLSRRNQGKGKKNEKENNKEQKVTIDKPSHITKDLRDLYTGYIQGWPVEIFILKVSEEG